MSDTQDDPYKTLAISKIRQNAKIEDIKVEKLGPDTYQLTCVQVSKPDQHVLVEMERTIGAHAANRQNLEARAAALHFFGEELGSSTGDGIPTPRLVHYDLAKIGNELSRPYLVRRYHPGIPAKSFIEHLSLEQRVLLAEKLGDLYRRILEADIHNSGPLRYERDDLGHEQFKIGRFHSMPTSFHSIPTSATLARLGSPTYRLLFDSLRYLLAEFSATGDGDEYEVFATPSNRYKKPLKILYRMEEYYGEDDGLFKDVTAVLVDEGLGPTRIILDKEPGRAVEYVPSPGTFHGPAFMACRPPAWLWNTNALQTWNIKAYQEWKEPGSSHLEAVTEDDIQVKKTFDKAAGPKYQRFAYEPTYKHARRLAWFALGHKDRLSDDFHDKETREAQDLLDKWNAFVNNG